MSHFGANALSLGDLRGPTEVCQSWDEKSPVYDFKYSETQGNQSIQTLATTNVSQLTVSFLLF